MNWSALKVRDLPLGTTTNWGDFLRALVRLNEEYGPTETLWGQKIVVGLNSVQAEDLKRFTVSDDGGDQYAVVGALLDHQPSRVGPNDGWSAIGMFGDYVLCVWSGSES